MKQLVYLAGPISGLTYDDGQNWRDHFIEELSPDILCASPLRAKSYLKSEGVLEQSYQQPLSSDKGVMTRDHFDCYRSDLILCNFLGASRISIGSVMECAWAHAYRKPLVLMMEKNNVHNHPMIRESAGFIVEDMEEAAEIIRAILQPR